MIACTTEASCILQEYCAVLYSGRVRDTSGGVVNQPTVRSFLPPVCYEGHSHAAPRLYEPLPLPSGETALVRHWEARELIFSFLSPSLLFSVEKKAFNIKACYLSLSPLHRGDVPFQGAVLSITFVFFFFFWERG